MQVHCDEGVATHIGPKPCAGIREDVGEASNPGVVQPARDRPDLRTAIVKTRCSSREVMRGSREPSSHAIPLRPHCLRRALLQIA